jgi:hypothetical protein
MKIMKHMYIFFIKKKYLEIQVHMRSFFLYIDECGKKAQLTSDTSCNGGMGGSF